jgi:non-lysosomal glucosylceramidase
LWIAACEATAAMAKELLDNSTQIHYSSLAQKARIVYVNKLWNGKYLNYDNSKSDHHDSIMADMVRLKTKTSLNF